jgi:Cys-tRNA(Pro)/Cys-tRNA(Cys) deacylase
MTPAINAAKKAGIHFRVQEYEHSPTVESFGLEAAEKLGLSPDQVFKTLVVTDGKKLYVGVLPVSNQLNLKLMAKALGKKRITMADKQQVAVSTGYVLGGVSPIGQKKSLPTIIDSSAQTLASINVSAGRRGLEIELSAWDLQRLTSATFADIS